MPKPKNPKPQFHPLCELFPAYSDEEFSELLTSIKHSGQIEPSVLLDGKILDGRHGYRGCLELGIEPKTVNFEDIGFSGTPLEFVLAKNLTRRHLDVSQRAMIASKLAILPAHRPSKKNKGANLPTYGIRTQAQAAEILNVSKRQVKSASKLRREASPDVIEQVERGKKTVHAALQTVKTKPVKQGKVQGQQVHTPTDDVTPSGHYKKSIAGMRRANTAITNSRTQIHSILNGFFDFLPQPDQLLLVVDLIETLRENYLAGIAELEQFYADCGVESCYSQ